MIGEVISKVATTFLEKGIESVKKSEEAKNLRSVYREQICRELSFNKEILYEIGKSYRKDDVEYRKQLIDDFEIEGYETINKSLLPFSVLFDRPIDHSDKEYFLNKKDIAKSLKETIKNQKNETDLLEYIYRKTKIAMKFSELDKEMNTRRYKNLQTLIQLMLNCLKREGRESNT